MPYKKTYQECSGSTGKYQTLVLKSKGHKNILQNLISPKTKQAELNVSSGGPHMPDEVPLVKHLNLFVLF